MRAIRSLVAALSFVVVAPPAAAQAPETVPSGPNDGPGWLRLGIAHRTAGRLDSAVVALERAIAAGVASPAPHVELARVRAKQGDRARAIDHLERAVAAGFGAPQVLAQPDFAPLAAEARFTALKEKVAAARYPCRDNASFRQFDFWLGSWDVHVNGGLAGTNDVTLLLEQCLVLENWTDRFGGQGKSMNFYEAPAQRWRQIWVADNGSTLDYAGSFRDGAMRFEGMMPGRGPGGAPVKQRLTFFPIAKDTVRQLFESSTDGGTTWTPGFDGLYVRRKHAGP